VILPVPEKCKQDYKLSMLLINNFYRSLHDAPPLQINIDLDKNAEYLSNKMAFTNLPVQNPFPNYGLNKVTMISKALPDLNNCAGKCFIFFLISKL
jgi:hypothetical protein